ncbi:PAS domain-containing protein [Mycetohabitans sp. B46]|uniref:PAS domain-containing protein n=1 Tax=Mycetohabitans sp. B46 TaxID=2772536 RepID=UPI00307EEA46
MEAASPSQGELVVEHLGFGLFVVDRQTNAQMWNRLMHDHSGKTRAKVLGKVLFESFPDRPRNGLMRSTHRTSRSALALA